MRRIEFVILAIGFGAMCMDRNGSQSAPVNDAEQQGYLLAESRPLFEAPSGKSKVLAECDRGFIGPEFEEKVVPRGASGGYETWIRTQCNGANGFLLFGPEVYFGKMAELRQKREQLLLLLDFEIEIAGGYTSADSLLDIRLDRRSNSVIITLKGNTPWPEYSFHSISRNDARNYTIENKEYIGTLTASKQDLKLKFEAKSGALPDALKAVSGTPMRRHAN
jgi:hypothetical protein